MSDLDRSYRRILPLVTGSNFRDFGGGGVLVAQGGGPWDGSSGGAAAAAATEEEAKTRALTESLILERIASS